MKQKIFFILLLSLICSNCFSQEDKKETFAVTISPLSLIDFTDGSSIRLGIDYVSNPDVLLSLETGIYNINQNFNKINPKGFLVKPGINYLISKGKNHRDYIGFEYMLKLQNYEVRDSLNANNVKSKKQYAINRSIQTLSLKYTLREKLGARFFYDFNVGFGVRFINSKSNLSEIEQNGVLDNEKNGASQAQDYINNIGKLVHPNFTLNFKIGYYLF